MILWICLALTLALIQGSSSVLLHEQINALRSAETWQSFLMISLFYGGCWFIPSVILADLIFLRRTLNAAEIRHYAGLCMACAVAVGLVTPGYLILIGYPITAFGILSVAYFHRKQTRLTQRK